MWKGKNKFENLMKYNAPNHVKWCIFIDKTIKYERFLETYWDSQVREANMGPTWVLLAPDGPHVGPMNFVIRVVGSYCYNQI